MALYLGIREHEGVNRMLSSQYKKFFFAVILMGGGLALGVAFNACSAAKFSKVAESDPARISTGINPDCEEPNCPQFCEGTRCEPCYGENCDQPKFPVHYTSNFSIPVAPNKVDLLMILDNSGSMAPEHKKLAQRLGNLIDVLNNNNVDWQICYTLTHVVDGTGAVKPDAGAIREWYNNESLLNFTPIGSKVLRKDNPNAKKYFADTLKTLALWDFGLGSGYEQPVHAGLLAIDRTDNAECFRSDAALAMVVLSDEDENSCAGRCQTTNDVGAPYPGRNLKLYTDQFRALTPNNNPETLLARIQQKWPQKPFTGHSIGILRDDRACYDAQDKDHPAFYGHVVQILSDITDAEKANICLGDYANQLTAIGQRTVKSLRSVSLRCAPESVEAIIITPNSGSTPTVSGNKVYFNPPLPEGTNVRVDYVCLE